MSFWYHRYFLASYAEPEKAEIGLRMALGAHRITLERYMYTEGLCLLVLTLPLLVIFAFNMAYMDQLDSYRQPLTFMRFLMTFSFTYLLMGAHDLYRCLVSGT